MENNQSTGFGDRISLPTVWFPTSHSQTVSPLISGGALQVVMLLYGLPDTISHFSSAHPVQVQNSLVLLFWVLVSGYPWGLPLLSSIWWPRLLLLLLLLSDQVLRTFSPVRWPSPGVQVLRPHREHPPGAERGWANRWSMKQVNRMIFIISDE